MTCPEIIPHFNKLVKVRLKNNRRKTGWLYFNSQRHIPEGTFDEVLCVGVCAGRKLESGIPLPESENVNSRVLVEEIEGIRSCL